MKLEVAQEITSQFEIDGRLVAVERFGEGHINASYAIYFAFDNQPTVRYLMQRINHHVFKNPQKLVDNIADVTDFLRQQIVAEGGDPLRETLTMVPTKQGGYLHVTPQGEYYRIYLFVENATCYQAATPELFYRAAKSFGHFAKALDAFNPTEMYDTIEKFHDTQNRYHNLALAIVQDSAARAATCQGEIAFAQAREGFCGTVLDEIAAGTVPLRACHNDTKLNNVMIDNATGEGLCVIDLDTVMKGSLLYDFGDSIRFGASAACEDEENLGLVYCDLEKYEIYVKGYLEEASSILSEREFDLLAHSAILMTFECGMRFLTDYLQGDVYFRIHKENHNLIRAKNQFKLVQDMEAKLDAMMAINQKYRT